MARQVTAGEHGEYRTGKTRWIEATIHESIAEAVCELPRTEAVTLLREHVGVQSAIDAYAIIDYLSAKGYDAYIMDDGDYAIVYIEFTPQADTGPAL